MFSEMPKRKRKGNFSGPRKSMVASRHLYKTLRAIAARKEAKRKGFSDPYNYSDDYDCGYGSYGFEPVTMSVAARLTKKLAGGISKLFGKKKKKKPAPAPTPAPVAASGLSGLLQNKQLLLIGGGVAALGAVMLLKKK